MRFGPGRAYGGHGCGEGRPPLPPLLLPLLPTIHRDLLPRLPRQLRLSKSPQIPPQCCPNSQPSLSRFSQGCAPAPPRGTLPSCPPPYPRFCHEPGPSASRSAPARRHRRASEGAGSRRPRCRWSRQGSRRIDALRTDASPPRGRVAAHTQGKSGQHLISLRTARLQCQWSLIGRWRLFEIIPTECKENGPARRWRRPWSRSRA